MEVDLGWDFWVDCGLVEKKRERERQKIKNSFLLKLIIWVLVEQRKGRISNLFLFGIVIVPDCENIPSVSMFLFFF